MVTFLAGALFAVGLALSRMTDPRVVVGFLDLAGDWNPRLAFVMAGAVAVFAAAFWLGRRWGLPAGVRLVGPGSPIDRRLIAGSALFGIGWGIAGFCPGPALTASAVGVQSALLFTVAMAAGLGLDKLLAQRGAE
jgi:hypothetical protein